MLSSLKNEYIAVEVSSTGAELMSIKSAKDGLEYIWQGNPTYWKRRSPLLFPIVGMLEGNSYNYKGKEYELEIHGFIKDCDFELFEKSEDTLVYRFKDNEVIRKKYPFSFVLQIVYKINGNSLSISHKVVNSGNETMWFSIGEHPAFNCPMFENETMEDYCLVFEEEESVNRQFIEFGLRNDVQEKFLDNEKTVALSEKLFKRLAIILKDLKSKSVTLKSLKHKRLVKVRFEGYPYLAIWSPNMGAPFVCIEPWYGVASKRGSSRNLTEKEGIMPLQAGREFNCGYTITVE